MSEDNNSCDRSHQCSKRRTYSESRETYDRDKLEKRYIEKVYGAEKAKQIVAAFVDARDVICLIKTELYAMDDPQLEAGRLFVYLSETRLIADKEFNDAAKKVREWVETDNYYLSTLQEVEKDAKKRVEDLPKIQQHFQTLFGDELKIFVSEFTQAKMTAEAIVAEKNRRERAHCDRYAIEYRCEAQSWL